MSDFERLERSVRLLHEKTDLALQRLENLIRLSSYLPIILRAVIQVETKMSALSDAVAELQTKVEADATVDGSAITLLNGLTEMIKQLQQQVADAADVPAAIEAVKAFSATLAANQASLGAAVAANTPAAPTS